MNVDVSVGQEVRASEEVPGLAAGQVYRVVAVDGAGVLVADEWGQSSRLFNGEFEVSVPCAPIVPRDMGLTEPTPRKETNPKDGAATSRLSLSLFPQTALAHGALAFTEGHCKYGAYNWRVAGVSAHVYVDAAMRHICKWNNGEEEDPATGVHHLGNALACVAVLLDAIECGKLVDDRPPPAPMAELLSRFEAKVKALQAKFPGGPPRCTR